MKKRVNITISEETHEKGKKLAKEYDISFSSLISKLILKNKSK